MEELNFVDDFSCKIYHAAEEKAYFSMLLLAQWVLLRYDLLILFFDFWYFLLFLLLLEL